jgi:predicted MFS family arabinose efflux permease
VVAALSSAAGFGLDAMSFGVSALTLWRLGATVAARSAARSVQTALSAQSAVAAPDEQLTPPGGRHDPGKTAPGPSSPDFRTFIRREPVVPLIIAIDIVANLGSAGTTEVALPLFAREHLHAGAGGYGALIACVGLGALAGSLLATRLNRARRPAVAAGLIFLAQVPLMACLPWAPWLAVAAAMVALWGGFNMWANVTTQTAFQRWAPPHLIGRLSGLLLTASYGMFPISVALAGLVAHRYGPDAFFILAAVTLAATLAWALSQQTFREFGMRPAAGPSAPPASPDRAAVAP